MHDLGTLLAASFLGYHFFSAMWSRWLVTILVLFIYQIVLVVNAGHNSNHNNHHHHHTQNFKITPKPCVVNGLEGTCMFVWECIRSEGQHVGMCVDSFMFGSCCSHNVSDNIILASQIFSYTRPTKPVNLNGEIENHQRPRPPSHSIKPNSGTTTIERPHGAGTLVIRPSGSNRPIYHKPTGLSTLSPFSSSSVFAPLGSFSAMGSSTTTAKFPSPSNTIVNDLETAASVAGSTWNTSPHTMEWQMTTEPNFITKPRPPLWEKPTSYQYPNKPQKPTKKPFDKPISSSSSPSSPSAGVSAAVPTVQNTRKPITTKPKPQVFYPKPTKPVTTLKPVMFGSHNTTRRPTTSGSVSEITTPITKTTTGIKTTSKPLSSSSLSPSLVLASSPSSSSSSSSIRPSFSSSSEAATIETNEIGGPSKVPRITTISAAKGECGMPSMLNRPETRIVGGKNAPFGRWPWQVSVRRTSFFGFSSTHRCGGALINENWIATAGHCVDDLLTSQIRIRVGEYDFSHVQEQLPYIERGVAKKVVHPKYNFFTYEYDLALVKLEQPLEFAPHVSPICLPGVDDLLIGRNATVTGWGRLSEGGTLPSVLQEVSVPIVSNDRCKSMFLRAGRQEFIPDIFLCAGYETGGQDSCQGDSGGPLQVKGDDGRYFLAGIISWGIGCAEANLPGVCTRISKFVPWMMENVT